MTTIALATKKTISAHSPQNAEQWREIWLQKLDDAMATENVALDRAEQIHAHIALYLTQNPYPPKMIYDNRLCGFLSTSENHAFEALNFFYSKVVQSPKHLAAITRVRKVHQAPAAFAVDTKCSDGVAIESQKNSSEGSEPVKHLSDTAPLHAADNQKAARNGASKKDAQPGDEDARLLELLREEVRVRNYAGSTEKNYLNAVSGFLDWLTPQRARDWSTAFKEHLIWLQQIKGNAPNIYRRPNVKKKIEIPRRLSRMFFFGYSTTFKTCTIGFAGTTARIFFTASYLHVHG